MSDINSTTPLGTETSLGVSTSSDAELTVLNFTANAGDGFFASIAAGAAGYWKTSDMAEWRPILATGLTIPSLPCNAVRQAWSFKVKRIPSGADVTDIRAGRVFIGVTRQ